MIKKIYILIFLIIEISANAQFNFIYRQYVLNQLGLNPAYTGSREVFVLASQYRNQWVGIDGAPVTYTISADSPMKNNNIALGFYGIHEQVGNVSNYNFDFNYAFRRSLNTGKLSLGLKTSAKILSISSVSGITQDDPVFMEEASTYIMPDFGVGIYYYDYNRFFLGLSVPSLLSYKGGSGNNGYKIYHDIKNYNFLGSGGYLFRLGDDVKLRLSTLIGYHLITGVSFDVNSMVLVKELIWAGGSYNSLGIGTIMAQWQINPQLRIGYAYDLNFGMLKQLHGAHEIMIRYEFSYIVKAVSPIF